MNLAAETLLFPYSRHMLESPKPGSRLLFLNAESPQLLAGIASSLVLMQPRYDKALPFMQAGHGMLTVVPEENSFDTVWVLPAKDIEETQSLLALAVKAAKDGGIIVAAAANDGGGKRLEGLFEKLGLAAQSESKNKCRVVFATVNKKAITPEAAAWLQGGQNQSILGGEVLSCPGLYGWSKVDAGSAILARHVPMLQGHVADFGCGWGYLSLEAAKKSNAITRLTLVDVDARAIRLAEMNVRQKNPELPVSAIWADLSHSAKPLGPYDVILLNPPFHDGTLTLPELGQAVITTAARSLKDTGILYLVANKHLPYELTLRAQFSQVNLLVEDEGFKTFVCKSVKSGAR